MKELVDSLRHSKTKEEIVETSEEGDSPLELEVLARRYGSPKKSLDVNIERPGSLTQMAKRRSRMEVAPSIKTTQEKKLS